MTIKTFIARLLILTVIAIVFCLPVLAQQRYALVIGNSDYGSIGRLKNPVNDASDMGKLLEQKGFKVTVLKNANKRTMQKGINQFIRQLYQKNAVGLFYFAGHGMQIDGRNYLIPVQVNIESETDVEYESVDAGRVLAGMRRAGNNLNMVVLDACRNNPFERSFRSSSRGLAKLDTAKGTLIMYAASAGEVASDGTGHNGLFTSHLMQAMNTPGLKVEDVFKNTALNVYQATNEKQLPWQSGVMLGSFYFTINAPKAKSVTISPPVTPGKQAEIEFWSGIKNSNNAAYFTAYLKRYGEKGIYSEIAKIKLNELTIGQEQAPVKQTRSRLTVRTSPEGARIRILNIGPKYQDGIALKPGTYHLEVTHSGYQRYLKWIELGDEDVYHSVVLDEKVQQSVAKPLSVLSSRPSSPSATDAYTGMQFVSVKPGCFQMGSEDSVSDRDEKPVHRVCLSEAYDLGKYEVTQAQWRKVMDNNPSRFSGNNRPVELVSWNDVQDFIGKLNRQTGLNYRLPTEAEWEYACRSGGKNQKYCGSNHINSIAWYGENSGSETHPVGQKQANGQGLYDMSGNVWEWVQDWFDSDYYGNSPANNPKGPAGGSGRVFRGGGWNGNAGGSRSANRDYFSPVLIGSNLGFRLARTR